MLQVFKCVFLLCVLSAFTQTMPVVASPVDGGFYSFGSTKPRALALYRQGWLEILEYGRWTESERLYREALRIDSSFVIGKAVLARITTDANERRELQRQIERDAHLVDADGQLILGVYVDTLTLIDARETGAVLEPGFRERMAEQAVQRYEQFVRKYPNEWSVLIEYIEWVHALDGAQAAISAAQTMNSLYQSSPSYSYFLAYFHAELKNFSTAIQLENEFSTRLDAQIHPQPFYIRAFIALQRGQYEAAQTAIEKALEIDPKHLLAQRLAREIDCELNVESC